MLIRETQIRTKAQSKVQIERGDSPTTALKRGQLTIRINIPAHTHTHTHTCSPHDKNNTHSNTQYEIQTHPIVTTQLPLLRLYKQLLDITQKP